MVRNDLLYIIETEGRTAQQIADQIRTRQEIKFVSLIGIDLAGNDTDERIPVDIFLQEMEDFFSGRAVQTDGSSVVLTGIATLNNAKVDMLADRDVKWMVDYNFEALDEETNKPIGTVRIPAFLRHDSILVDSRAILKNSMEYVRTELLALFSSKDAVAGLEHINLKDIVDIEFTVGTELEFWVKTPAQTANVEELSATQVIQENYWQRTRGKVRSAMEHTMLLMEKYGLKPEMGHKEVGGVKARIDSSGDLSHVLEQLEIDWRFDDAMQAADNELWARSVVKEVFRSYGLEVTFKAKPIIGVAGSGEHTHVGIAARMRDGSIVNLFSPADMKKDFLSAVGLGAIMGILKNYEVINPFVTSTNDAFNRLKPGFEAPVCIVTSIGHNPAVPSRNRTVLAGLVRDTDNPRATRFEVRAPNPFTNTYLAVAAFYVTMLDGVKAAVNSGYSVADLEGELSKEPEVDGFYLEQGRSYRSEHDVFDDYSDEERDRRFGKPPATVWENMMAFSALEYKTAVLSAGGVFRSEIISAFVEGALTRWKTELLNRIIPENFQVVVDSRCLHNGEFANDYDYHLWNHINGLRYYLAKDNVGEKGLFTRIKEAINNGDYRAASDMQKEMSERIEELKQAYLEYRRNSLDGDYNN